MYGKYIKNTSADVIISTRVFLNELLSEYGKETTLKIGWDIIITIMI